MNKPNLEKGDKIRTVQQLVDALERHSWIYIGDVPQHPEEFMHEPLGVIIAFIKKENIGLWEAISIN